MIAIFSPSEDSIAMKPTLVKIGYQLRVLIRAVSCKIERHFAAFASVPYDDPLSRQLWEQLLDSTVSVPRPYKLGRISRTPRPGQYESIANTNVQLSRIPSF
jgi:hypothetical protein